MTEPTKDEDRLHVVFTDEESENIHAAAQWYREFCASHGIEPHR